MHSLACFPEKTAEHGSCLPLVVPTLTGAKRSGDWREPVALRGRSRPKAAGLSWGIRRVQVGLIEEVEWADRLHTSQPRGMSEALNLRWHFL